MQYLLKIDISGIQTFIFDVPSKGASRQLKARSVYVQMLTHLAEEFFKNTLGKIEVLYNGGGNLFFFVESQEEQLRESIREFQRDFATENIFPIVAYVPKNEEFKATMQALAQKANIAKLQKPLYTHSYDYQPTNESKWKEITENLIEATGFVIEAKEKNTSANPLSKAGLVLKFSKIERQFEGTILNKLPLSKDKSITEFDEIAQKATGDSKLAALKMDVDNLGQLFRNKNQDEYQRNSKILSEFFEKKIYEILKEYIKNEYIYPIFSGGDDCFLIGAWDKILEAAGKIQKAFDDYQSKNDLHLTLSAGVVIVPPKFPMVRIAEEAEHALELSKKHSKNKITLFGEPLTWNDFAKAQEYAKKFQKLIDEQNASRAVLHRIKSSDIGFTRLQEKAQNGKLNFPKVHRLKYYLRNFKDKPEIKEIVEQIFKEYEQALLQTFMKREKALNPMVFPVAARWAELLTKSRKETENP